MPLTDEKKEFWEDVGRRIRAERLRRHLDQKAFGQEIAATGKEISRWENADRKPRRKSLEVLAIISHKSVAWFLLGIDENRYSLEARIANEVVAETLGEYAESGDWELIMQRTWMKLLRRLTLKEERIAEQQQKIDALSERVRTLEDQLGQKRSHVE